MRETDVFCQQFFRRSQKAFSLMELLIVIAIIGILTAITLVNVVQGKKIKDVESAALFASTKMREAQTFALTGQQYIPNTLPCAYRVAWGSSNITSSYLYKDGTGACNQSTTIVSSSLPSQVQFSGTGSMDFVLPYAQINADQVVTVQQGGVSQVICVSTNGRIEPKAAAADC